MTQARVAVDALGHLDAQRQVLPLRVPLVRINALVSGSGGHACRLMASPRRLVSMGRLHAPLPPVATLPSRPAPGSSPTMPRRIDQEARVADKQKFLSDGWFDAAE